MRVTINDTDYEVPFDLTQIRLGEFMEYQAQYGKDLDKKLKEIVARKYEGSPEDADLQRLNELEDHLDLEALCWYSYWTKFDLIEAKSHPFITPLLNQYKVLRYLLKDDSEITHEFPCEFEWNGEQWCISDFKVNPASDMCFNEIITSKEVMRQVNAIGGNKWDSMIYLCAIYCRKKGEAFIDKFVQDGERMEELKNLPLNYALSIAFFLISCVNTWRNTSAYSADGALAIASLNLTPITKSGDGSTSFRQWPRQKYLISQAPAWTA